MTIHILHRLVSSALLYLRKASWGYCVSVFDSSGKPAALPVIGGSGVPGGFKTEFGVGRTTSCDDGANIPKIPSMEKLELISEKHLEALPSALKCFEHSTSMDYMQNICFSKWFCKFV